MAVHRPVAELPDDRNQPSDSPAAGVRRSHPEGDRCPRDSGRPEPDQYRPGTSTADSSRRSGGSQPSASRNDSDARSSELAAVRDPDSVGSGAEPLDLCRSGDNYPADPGRFRAGSMRSRVGRTLILRLIAEPVAVRIRFELCREIEFGFAVQGRKVDGRASDIADCRLEQVLGRSGGERAADRLWAESEECAELVARLHRNPDRSRINLARGKRGQRAFSNQREAASTSRSKHSEFETCGDCASLVTPGRDHPVARH